MGIAIKTAAIQQRFDTFTVFFSPEQLIVLYMPANWFPRKNERCEAILQQNYFGYNEFDYKVVKINDMTQQSLA